MDSYDPDDRNSVDAPRFGNYLLLDTLGKGGFSSVYRAEFLGDFGFRKHVALKMLHTEARGIDDHVSADFLNEARLGASVRHTNLVEFYECGRVGKRLYIAMELVDGPNLRQVIDVARFLTSPVGNREIVTIALMVARGLKALHQAKVKGSAIKPVHQDLKPANILLSPEGQAKLTDYGIARFAADFYETMGRKAARGSPLYMSPEQVRGERPNQASDVFAFGATILELITGVPVFAAPTIAGVLEKVRNADAGPALITARKRFPDLVEVLETCMLPDADQRFADGAALVEGLKAIEPPAFGDELIARLASEAFGIVREQRDSLDQRPVQRFWGGVDGGSEDSVSVRLSNITDAATRGRTEARTADEEAEQRRVKEAIARLAIDTGGGAAAAPIPGAGDGTQRRTPSRWPLVAIVILVLLLIPVGIGFGLSLGGSRAGRADMDRQPTPGDPAAGSGGEADAEVPTAGTDADDMMDGTTDGATDGATVGTIDGTAGAGTGMDAGKAGTTEIVPDEPTTPEPATPAATGGSNSWGGTGDAGAGPPRLQHTAITRAVRGQDIRFTVTISPPGRYRSTVWYRAGADGAWQTQNIDGGESGTISVTIPSGVWQQQGADRVDYFIEVAGPGGIARSGSAVRPYSFELL